MIERIVAGIQWTRAFSLLRDPIFTRDSRGAAAASRSRADQAFIQAQADQCPGLFVAQVLETGGIAAPLAADRHPGAMLDAEPARPVPEKRAVRQAVRRALRRLQRAIAHDTPQVDRAAAGRDHQPVEAKGPQAASLGKVPFRPVGCQPAAGHFFNLKHL